MKHLARGFALGLFVLLANTACQTTDSSGRFTPAALDTLSDSQLQQYRQALALLAAEDAAAAEALLQGLSENRKDVPEIWFNLALAHYQQDELEPAQEALTTLLKYRDTAHQGHNLSGLIAVQRGEFESANQHYLKALKLQPTYANALYNMALLQDIYLQDVEQAIAYYQKYLVQVPQDEETKTWIENLQYSLEDL